ncbi:hypothetical protein DRO59_07070 [Candidatus Bathyarchaeota archaeon]|nr:MAG: hypothetical protein DRO59_07070 [Candidatus Bathyarchaeota archaeon]
MIDEKEKEDVEEVREILGVVSKEIPALIKGIIASVFSEEAGKDMGRAVAAFYKELKESGMPEQTAVRMAENYMSTFTSLGDVLKKAMSGKGEFKGEEIGEEISRKIREELSKKQGEEEKEEE